MELKQSKWQFRETVSPKISEKLSQELNINKILSQILVRNGITNYQDAEQFFCPDLSRLNDPFLLKDMDKAVSRILSAFEKHEKILLFGDYDVDGTTSVSLCYLFFKQLGKEISFYIPDRHKEGYGVSFQGIDYAHENGFSLIISLDCGIRSVNHINYATDKGIDFIICDHHLPGLELPKAKAILNPKQVDCLYPYKELSGCGVGLKLCQALLRKLNLPDSVIYAFLDLAAVSIACDIVPITDENRILCYFGLKLLNENPRPGIKALLDYNVKKKYGINELLFTVGPRINAAGRLADAKQAVRLLIEQDFEKAYEMAKAINEHNSTRKNIDSNITFEANQIIASDTSFINKNSTVVFSKHWHKGVVGIVASRLVELYYKPTIVLCEHEGKITGSARSVAGFDIYSAISDAEEHLLQFGGHHFAAGLTLLPQNLVSFTDKFENAVKSRIKEEQKEPIIWIDGELGVQHINQGFVKTLLRMEPFGPGNMNPIFLLRNIKDTGMAKTLGSDEKHLKLNVMAGETIVGVTAFNFGHYYHKVKAGMSFDICGHLEKNHFNGNESLEIRVIDMKPSNHGESDVL
jgi:single-stranded-DNA-specific exonuclease